MCHQVDRLRDLTVILNDYGIRPAGPRDRCWYCRHVIGERHEPDCVVVVKEIELEASFPSPFDRRTVRWKTTVPHAWSERDVVFQFNEGTWCADNITGEREDDESFLRVVREALLAEGGRGGYSCLCGVAKVTLVRVVDEGPYIPKREEGEPW